MNALVDELKTRARLGLNAIEKGDFGLIERAARANGRPRALAKPQALAKLQPTDWKLRHCLTLAAAEVGFSSWDQARRVLAGQAAPGDDMGGFWHAPRCNSLLSHWFAGYDDAKVSLAAASHRTLLPYRRQFVVVDGNYLRELGLAMEGADGDSGGGADRAAGDNAVAGVRAAWRDTGRDLVAAYGSPAWIVLCGHRLRACRAAASRTAD